VRGPVLLLLGLVGCLEPAAIQWPDPQAEERTMLIVVSGPAAVSAYAFEAGGGPPLPQSNAGVLSVTVAFLRLSLTELGWSAGRQDLVADGSIPLLPLGQPARVVTTEVRGKNADVWVAVSEVPPTLAALRRPNPMVGFCPRLDPQPEATVLPKTTAGEEVGEVAVILPRGAEILAATGHGFRFSLNADRTATLISNADRPADYSAGFRDRLGRNWLTGYGMFLRRLDDRDTNEIQVVGTSTQTPVTPVHLDGGLVDGRVQLMAIAPYPAADGLGRKFFVWNEGDPQWTSHPLPDSFGNCPPGLACDAWRITWLGPDRGLFTGRGPHLVFFRDGEFEEQTLPGCGTYSAGLLRANGRAAVACQGGGGVDRVLELNESGVVLAEGGGLSRKDVRLVTYAMFEAPPFLLLGGADGYIGLLRDLAACGLERAGLADISMIQPLGDAYAISAFKFDDIGIPVPDQGRTLRWLRLSGE
jgi:hypothetical protein